MPNGNYEQFVVLFFFGLGLALASVAGLILRKSSAFKRAAAALAASAVAVGGCWAFEENSALLAPLAAMLLAVVAPVWFLGTTRGSAALLELVGRLTQPPAAWRVCAFAGLAVVAGAAARWQARDDLEVAADLAAVTSLEQLEQDTNRSSTRPAPIRVTTDRGAPVLALVTDNPRTAPEQRRIEDELFRRDRTRDAVIRRGPSGDCTNCFGWVFTGGRYWLPGSEVEAILQDNGYRETARPRHGDLVVYRKGGNIAHVAVVRYTARNQPVMVEGKWGRSGVYLHAVDASMYGEDFTYMRSPRVGHLLAGLPSVEPLANADEQLE
jgi:hypothetical protein